MSADRDIRRVRELRPVVADLAKSLSLSANIDVSLVRALRMKLFSDADVSSEADLWASPLVDSRREGALTLRTDVREQFWAELRADREALARLWAVLDLVRTDTRPLVLLEERLTYCALTHNSDGIERELNKVINAMVADLDRRPSLATWAAQALGHLPASVRDSDAAKILGSVARAWVPTPTSVAALTPSPDAMSLVEQLRPPTGKQVTIWVARSQDLVEASLSPLPDGVAIPNVSAANPILFVGHDRSYRIAASGTTRIDVPGIERVMIGTIDRRRWWLEQRQESPSADSVVFPEIAGTVRGCYLVSPNRMVSSSVNWSAQRLPVYFALGDQAENLELLATDFDADVSIFRLQSTTELPPLELTEDVIQGQTWQAFTPSGTRVVGTVASGWPRLMLRVPPNAALPAGTPVFSGTRVIGHIASDGADGDLLHAVSARTIRWWIDQVLEEPLVIEDFERPASKTVVGRTIWTQQLPIDGEVPRELPAPFGPRDGDLVLMFANGLRPMGVYQVTQPETGLESIGAPEMNMRLSLWNTNAAPTKGLGEISEQPRRVDTREAYEYLDRGYLPRRAGELEAIVGEDIRPRVVIEIPERISTGGLLGVSLGKDGEHERSRRHSWGAFTVQLLDHTPLPVSREGYRIKVTAVEHDPRTAHMEFAARMFPTPDKSEFFRACDVAIATFLCEPIRPKRSQSRPPNQYDLELVVNHVPFVAPAHAYRRGVQFVTAVLDAMDFPGRPRDVSHAFIDDAGTLDLVDAQQRIAMSEAHARLVWIDPETGIVEIRFDQGENRTGLHDRLARALERERVEPLPSSPWRDLIQGRFGHSNRRSGRVMNVEIRGDARVSVRSTTTQTPVLGYVDFYFTSSERTIDMTRVRAVGGVAELRIPLRDQSFAIGAVIEDEGLMLEHWVGPTRGTQEALA